MQSILNLLKLLSIETEVNKATIKQQNMKRKQEKIIIDYKEQGEKTIQQKIEQTNKKK